MIKIFLEKFKYIIKLITNLRQIYNKKVLGNLYKDIVLSDLSTRI